MVKVFVLWKIFAGRYWHFISWFEPIRSTFVCSYRYSLHRTPNVITLLPLEVDIYFTSRFEVDVVSVYYE